MEEIKILLDKLGLIGIKMHLSEVMDLVDGSCISSVREVLQKLLTVEYEYKKSRSLHYRLQLARFPTIKILSDTAAAKLVENIDAQKLIDNHKNVILIGGSGSAKTHLAIGLAFNAIERGYRVRFYTLSGLATQLFNARIHNYEIQFMDSVKRFHLIIVDELGYVPIKPEARSLLFERQFRIRKLAVQQ